MQRICRTWQGQQWTGDDRWRAGQCFDFVQGRRFAWRGHRRQDLGHVIAWPAGSALAGRYRRRTRRRNRNGRGERSGSHWSAHHRRHKDNVEQATLNAGGIGGACPDDAVIRNHIEQTALRRARRAGSVFGVTGIPRRSGNLPTTPVPRTDFNHSVDAPRCSLTYADVHLRCPAAADVTGPRNQERYVQVFHLHRMPARRYIAGAG